jgi:tetratricopeptide (TPR) repeat protein
MPTADSAPAERLKYIHQLALPSKWAMEKELAMRLISLGVLKSALEILERLEMWAEVVECWQALEKPERGREIVKDLLEGRKREADVVQQSSREQNGTIDRDSFEKRHVEGKISPMDRARQAKLWCLLGEVEPTNAEAHFRKAWEVSNHTSGRAMRSLGGYYFARGKYTEATECLKEAVKIQPLLSRSWFILGCSFIRMDFTTDSSEEEVEKKEKQKWREARDAFARCVMIDEEDAESWNNLASAYLRLGVEDDDKEVGDFRDIPTVHSNQWFIHY